MDENDIQEFASKMPWPMSKKPYLEVIFEVNAQSIAPQGGQNNEENTEN